MTTATPEDIARNALLAKLTRADLERLTPHLLILDLKSGYTLQAAGEEVVNTWFPLGAAMASFCVTTVDGAGVEVALVGREGAIGGIVSNGHVPAYASAEVRFGGRFLRIKTSALERCKLDSISLRHWFSRYSDCLLAQVFQTAVCNAKHTIEQRTAKWLLAAADRTGGSEFEMTQEQLAGMLGVGRTFVTRIVKRLRDEGMISTRRGAFVIRNEALLRETACDCTTEIENHFDVVLHGIYRAE